MKHELLRSDCFCLEIDGVSTAGFRGCRGLAAERDVLLYAEGGAATARAFGGPKRWANLVLESGIVRGSELREWFERGDARDVAVVLLSAGGEERARWEVASAWPCRWEGPELDADRADVAVEVLELAHEGLSWPAR